MDEYASYKPKIKICGIKSEEDIEIINEAKPDYCGFIINYPESHRSISPKREFELMQMLDPSIRAVGVFVNSSFKLISEMLNYGAIDVAQLHGNEDEDYIDRLKAAAPEGEIWKAFKIPPGADGMAAKKILRQAELSLADIVLLDAGAGHGVAFDHSILAYYRRPFFLAGGLHPENVGAVIAEIRPYGVDVSSGVETDKVKDKEKVLRFVHEAKDVFGF